MNDAATDMPATITAEVAPSGILEILSRHEMERLLDTGKGGMYELFRRCCLAVLNCGAETDDARGVCGAYPDFSVELLRRERGVKLRLCNAPATAFVDDRIIQGIQEHLFAVLRDLIYAHDDILSRQHRRLSDAVNTTDVVFHVLRNARILRAQVDPSIVVCWGGHAIARREYDYTKEVGYQLGLRGLDICTGCGPGAMKGPMKGAAVAHAKQRRGLGRYIGVTEPGIIAAEPPNPIVNELVILPDIEKRLEAFVRLGHGVVVFPGGVGTAEEILYLLGILLDERNAGIPLPMILTGPAESAAYFEQIDRFIRATLGAEATARYTIIVDDAPAVARAMREGIANVRQHRRDTHDAFYFNWALHVAEGFQQPFDADHESMARLRLQPDLPRGELAADLRRAFSGIVAGNVKESGIAAVEAHGPFVLTGDAAMLGALDELLAAFVAEGRMKLGDRPYEPVYRLAA